MVHGRMEGSIQEERNLLPFSSHHSELGEWFLSNGLSLFHPPSPNRSRHKDRRDGSSASFPRPSAFVPKLYPVPSPSKRNERLPLPPIIPNSPTHFSLQSPLSRDLKIRIGSSDFETQIRKLRSLEPSSQNPKTDFQSHFLFLPLNLGSHHPNFSKVLPTRKETNCCCSIHDSHL